MRRRVLCGCWARLAFPRAREKKKKKKSNWQFTHSTSLAKILQPSSAAARRRGIRNTPDRGSIGEWSGCRERCMARTGGAPSGCARPVTAVTVSSRLAKRASKTRLRSYYLREAAPPPGPGTGARPPGRHREPGPEPGRAPRCPLATLRPACPGAPTRVYPGCCQLAVPRRPPLASPTGGMDQAQCPLLNG